MRVESCSSFRRHVTVSKALVFGTDEVRRYCLKYKEDLSKSVMLILTSFNGVYRTGETTYSRQWHEIIIKLEMGRPDELPSYPDTDEYCDQSQGQQSPCFGVTGHSCESSAASKPEDKIAEDESGSWREL